MNRTCLRCLTPTPVGQLRSDGYCVGCAWCVDNRAALKELLGDWQPETDKSEKKTEA